MDTQLKFGKRKQRSSKSFVYQGRLPWIRRSFDGFLPILPPRPEIRRWTFSLLFPSIFFNLHCHNSLLNNFPVKHQKKKKKPTRNKLQTKKKKHKHNRKSSKITQSTIWKKKRNITHLFLEGWFSFLVSLKDFKSGLVVEESSISIAPEVVGFSLSFFGGLGCFFSVLFGHSLSLILLEYLCFSV